MTDRAWIAGRTADLLEPPPTDVFGLIGYTPTARQETFHAASEFDVLYGGAAGGGKTKSLLMHALSKAAQYPGLKVFAFRRTYPELQDSFIAELASIGYARQLDAKWNASEHILTLPNGATIRFRYCATMKDASAYLSAEIHLLIIDERTTMLPAVVEELVQRVRSGNPSVPVLGVRSATNPGNIGHAVVKAQYVDAGPWGEPIWDEATETFRRFIPARVSDNPHVDPGYVKRLNRLPEDRRRALQDGDWDVYEGQRFGTFRREVHVIEPEEFPIPDATERAQGVDYGFEHPFACYWAARFSDDIVVVYRELVASGLTPTEQAGAILDLEAPSERAARVAGRPPTLHLAPDTYRRDPSQPNPPGRTSPHAPPAGSIAWKYRAAGLAIRRANNDRVSGAAELSDRLRLREDGQPRLYIYSTCRELIACLPALQRDPVRPEDVLKVDGDDPYDALRYLLMGWYRPGAPSEPAARWQGHRRAHRPVSAGMRKVGF